MRLNPVPEMPGDIYRIVPTLVVTLASFAGSSARASAECKAGVGSGASALVGGSSITLQSVSVQVQAGVNAALGASITALEPMEQCWKLLVSCWSAITLDRDHLTKE